MLVESMTYEEKVRYLYKIEDKLYDVVNRVVERTCKHIKKGIWTSLGTRSIVLDGDRYYYSIITQRIKGSDFNTGGSSYTIRTRDNGQRYVLSFHTRESIKFEIYELHVFERYRERYLKNPSLSLEDCIKLFFENTNMDMVSRIVIHKDDSGYARMREDGILLCDEGITTTIDTNIRHWKTFITEDMLFSDQSYLSKYGDEWNRMKDFWEECKKDKINGVRKMDRAIMYSNIHIRTEVDKIKRGK